MPSAKAFLGLLICLCLQSIAAKSLSGLNQAFMITGSRGSKNLLRRQTRSMKSAITSMYVTSVIRSRFAKVTTVSEMENTHDEAKEMTFSVRLPEAAFITEFTMLVDGVTFVGKVKEKALAEEEYQRAKAAGNSAGLVSANVRETQTFSVAANVPAHSSVTFTFVYQELLKRRLGKYNHDIFVNPSQIVDDFVVNVYITEQIGITMLKAETPRGGAESRGKVASGYDAKGEVAVETHVRRSKHQAKVTFKPTPTQQRRLLMIPEDDRKMTVVYDVTRENLGGEIQTRDGYFVHYFAPQDLPVLPKKVVFVIDRSGSMSGRKMEQTKVAFETVLKDMSDADEFNIVDFADRVNVWKPKQLVSVTEENVQEAISYVKGIVASGGTNLNGGLLHGAKLLKHVKPEDRVSSAIITLTDGDPTSGVTNEAQIRMNVKSAVNGRFSVFCIGFGKYLNHDFLKRMANENDGITRKIYEDSDADLQLKGFFQEVATPLLLKVSMTYSGSEVADVSKMHTDKYFGGSEVIIVGAKLDADTTLKSRVVGTSVDGEVVYDVVGEEVDENFRHWYEDTGDFSDFIERIWAYFTINELLEQKVLADSTAEVKSIVKRVTDLALKYKFVTPMTSMVVVLPEDEITTTPSTSTIMPPPPPCYLRGSQVPEDYIIEPIWCPYIFEKQEDNHEPRVSSSLGRVAYSRNRAGPPALAAMPALMPMSGSSISSKVGMHASPALSSFGGFYPIANYPSYDMMEADYGYRNTYIPPEKADNCSGILTDAEGNIASPAAHHAETTVYCEWDIRLAAGSWIDLNIVTLDTTENEVVVSSNGEDIVSHHGGVGAPKYFSVTNNEVRIKMTIHPEDTKQPGIVISYAQFTPDTSSSKAVDAALDMDSPNCGHRITPEDGQSGFITSPNYPAQYSRNAKCLWTIFNNDTASQDIRLQVLHMDIEIDGDSQCGHDKMAVFTNGEESKQLCGSQAGKTFTSSEEVVKVAFTSDSDLESGGFKASYEFVPK